MVVGVDIERSKFAALVGGSCRTEDPEVSFGRIRWGSGQSEGDEFDLTN